MSNKEYVLSVIKDKYIITKPPVRAILTQYLTKTKHKGFYVEFKSNYRPDYIYRLFINDTVGYKYFHNAPNVLCVPDIEDCLWFKEYYDKIKIIEGLFI
jgi:hypothetical protein|nr:MAG TPA: hypothetical protein [Caudoviricetes sp.]